MSELSEKKRSVATKMRGEHSETKPVTVADHKLSIQHLRKRISFNRQNTRDHERLMSQGGSKKYNKDHIKHHDDQVKHDEKLIKERAKTIKKAK